LTAALCGPLTPTATAQVTPCPDLVAEIEPVDPLGCDGADGATTNLDGTGSTLGVEPPVTYLWSATAGSIVDDTALTTMGTFPVGTTTVTLTVSCDDGTGSPPAPAEASIDVIVGDTVPPILSATADKACLWPPNHKYHTVNAEVTATDTCDPDPAIALDSVVSNEPDEDIGDGNTVDDILLGSDDSSFRLRSERQGPGTGRVYTASYSATDASGNFASDSVLVVVPHDMGQGAGECKVLNKAAKAAAKAAKRAAKVAEKDAKNAAKAAAKAAKAAAKAAGNQGKNR
jgi:hypothetical protein